MKVLIHDLDHGVFRQLCPVPADDMTIIDQTKKIQPCTGCFGCWVKTPASCVIKDDYQRMGALYNRCAECIIISRCTYGCYSPFIKNVLDRSINWILPFFVKRNGEMHHPRRYPNRFGITVHFYGEGITQAEKKTAEKLVQANAVNMDAREFKIYFHPNPSAIKGVI